MGDTLPSNLYAADNIYNSGFTTIWNIPKADPGHPTLYPIIIALFWAALGKTLLVTHAVQVLVGFGLTVVLYKIANGLVSERTAQFATLFFCITPFYVAQLTGASLQLPLTLAAALAFYYSRQQKYLLYTLGLCAMMLLHLQGAFLLLFLCIDDAARFYYQNGYKRYNEWFVKRFNVYAAPFLVFMSWGVFHFLETGWVFSSPNYLRGAPGLAGAAYNLGIAVWRIIDFGYIIPLLAVFLFFIKRLKKLYLGDALVQLFITYLLALMVLGAGISLLFAYPPIHRYFLPSTLFLIILFAAVLEKLKPTVAKAWAVLAGIVLVAGNFMYYPGKCIGDSNIAYLPIYQIEKQLTTQFPKGTEFYTYAPLSYPSAIRYLDSSQGPVFKELYHTHIDSATYVAQSNMNCEFSPEELQKLKGWHGTTFERGGIYINVYANPAKVPVKPTGWQLREPSKGELWMKQMKGKLKD